MSLKQVEPNKFEEMKKKLDENTQTIINEFKQKPECKNYDPTAAAETSNKIAEAIVKSFSGVYPTYKFGCTCTILNKKEGGLHMSSSCYWDEVTDGNVLIKDENEALYIIANTFVMY
jgi:dynein light chain Tctex-type 1